MHVSRVTYDLWLSKGNPSNVVREFREELVLFRGTNWNIWETIGRTPSDWATAHMWQNIHNYVSDATWIIDTPFGLLGNTTGLRNWNKVRSRHLNSEATCDFSIFARRPDSRALMRKWLADVSSKCRKWFLYYLLKYGIQVTFFWAVIFVLKFIYMSVFVLMFFQIEVF